MAYILYMEQGCPFSRRVMTFMKKHKLKVKLRDSDEHRYEKELIARGGKRQTPYLVDTDSQIEMYESQDIIDYLQKQLKK